MKNIFLINQFENGIWGQRTQESNCSNEEEFRKLWKYDNMTLITYIGYTTSFLIYPNKKEEK